MLRARYPNDLSVDAKGRLQLPNRVREELGIEDGGTMEFHVGVLLDPCVYVHTEEQHERFLEAFEEAVDDTDRGRMLKTMVHERFSPVTNDRTGRLNIPERMRGEAGFTEKVVLISMRDRIELWAAEKFAALKEANEADFRKGLEAALGRVGEMRRSATSGHADD